METERLVARIAIVSLAIVLLGVFTTHGASGPFAIQDARNAYIKIECADRRGGDCVDPGTEIRHYRIVPVGYKCAWDGRVLDCKLLR